MKRGWRGLREREIRKMEEMEGECEDAMSGMVMEGLRKKE